MLLQPASTRQANRHATRRLWQRAATPALVLGMLAAGGCRSDSAARSAAFPGAWLRPKATSPAATGLKPVPARAATGLEPVPDEDPFTAPSREPHAVPENGPPVPPAPAPANDEGYRGSDDFYGVRPTSGSDEVPAEAAWTGRLHDLFARAEGPSQPHPGRPTYGRTARPVHQRLRDASPQPPVPPAVPAPAATLVAQPAALQAVRSAVVLGTPLFDDTEALPAQSASSVSTTAAATGRLPTITPRRVSAASLPGESPLPWPHHVPDTLATVAPPAPQQPLAPPAPPAEPAFDAPGPALLRLANNPHELNVQ